MLHVIGNTKHHSSPQVGQECSVVNKGKGELSSVAGKLHLSYGTEKEQEVRQGHLAELSHFLLGTSDLDHAAHMTQAGSLGPPGSRLRRDGQKPTASILVCSETNGPTE